MADWSWVGPVANAVGQYAGGMSAGNQANSTLQGAYDEMLRNLQARFGDYDALGAAGYQDVTPEQLGDTALASIPEDLGARQAQQESIAALGDLSQHGGLSLADMQALNEIQGNLNRNNMARQKGLANEFAARGQLGSGAQLAMGLANQQNAAMNANQAGETAAAQAQQRAMEAILRKGEMARGMSSDDYRRKAAAAQAKDAIMARNAAARSDAARYNNSLRGQTYQDRLAQAAGKTSLTNAMNKGIMGKADQSARTTVANASRTGKFGNDLQSAFGTQPTQSTEPTDSELQDEADTNQGDDD